MHLTFPTELDHLRHCEAIVRRHTKSAWEFVRALAEIKTEHLWKHAEPSGDEGDSPFANWDDYCQRRFGFTKNYANRLVNGLDTIDSVPIGTDLNEAQARELRKVPKDKREAVLDCATEKADGKPLTAAAIRKAAAEVLEAEPEEEPDDDSSLATEATDTPQDFAPCDDTGVDEEEVGVEPERNSEPPSAFAVAVEADVRRRMKEHGTQGFMAAVILENLAVKLRG